MTLSSSSDRLDEVRPPILPKSRKVTGEMKGRAITHLDRMERAICIFASLSIAFLVASIALLALAQAEYVHPLYSVGAFAGCIGAFIIVKAIDCCQNSVARNHNLDLQKDYYEVKYPIPKKKGVR